MIRCRYCKTEFEHNGRVELQQCPECKARLVCDSPYHKEGE